jgi:repressor LexA
LFQDKFDQLLKRGSVTAYRVAKDTNIAQGLMGQYARGEKVPASENLRKIAEYFNVSMEYFLSDDYDTPFNTPPASTGGVWIPILGNVAGGVPFETIEDVVGWEEISLDTAAKGEHIALVIEGDSMAPRMLDGDIVVVHLQASIEDGEVAVVLIANEATVKRVKKGLSGITLIPNNPVFDPIFYSNEEIESLPITIFGKVVELRGKP